MRVSPLFRVQCGATLVETLIASLVLAIGVLGTSLLFVHGLQTNRSALLRGEAIRLVADLAERLRAGAVEGTEFADWRAQVSAILPAPRDGRNPAVLQIQAGNPTRYRIGAAWSEPGQSAVWTHWHVLDLPTP